MARLMTTGFEQSSGTTSEFGLTQSGSGTATTNMRSGARSLSFAGTASNAALFQRYFTTFVLGTTYYSRIYARFTALPTASIRLMSFKVASGTDTGATVRLTSAGKIQLGSVVTGTVTQQGSDSAATLAVNTYYRLELAYRVGTGATDFVEAYLDGVLVGSASTLSITDTVPTLIDLGLSAAWGAVSTVQMDDFAVNDSNGATQNSYPGDGKVVWLPPVTPDNARVGWTVGGGGTTNLFAAVSNVPVAGVADASATATSQIRTPNNNTTDTYDANLRTYTTAGITASDLITVVHPYVTFGPATAAAQSIGLQMLSNPTITEAVSASGAVAVGAGTTGWTSVLPIISYLPAVTLGTSPVLRVRRATASANALDVEAMGAYVEYIPNGAVTVVPSRNLLGVGV